MSSKRAWYADYTYQVPDPFAGLPADLVTLINSELTPDEQVLWMQQPIFRFSLKNFLSTAVSSIWWWVLISIWVIRTPSEGLSIAGIILAYLVCIALITWRKTSVARHSLWLVTSQRVAYFRANSKRVLSLYYNYQIKPGNIKIEKRQGGRGDLLLIPEAMAQTYGLKLKDIDQVDYVKGLIEQRLEQNAGNPIQDLPVTLQRLIKAELAAGEQVLWVDQPDWTQFLSTKNSGFTWHKTGMITLSALLLFSVFVVIPMVTIAFNTLNIWVLDALLAAGLGIPLFLITRSYLKKSYKLTDARNTAYLITDQRFMEVTAQPEKITTYYPSQYQQGTVIRRATSTSKTDLADLYLIKDEAAEEPEILINFVGITNPITVEKLMKRQLGIR